MVYKYSQQPFMSILLSLHPHSTHSLGNILNTTNNTNFQGTAKPSSWAATSAPTPTVTALKEAAPAYVFHFGCILWWSKVLTVEQK